MWSKAKPQVRPTGKSFPFLERKGNSMSLRYDKVEFERHGDQFTVTFYLGETPMYSITEDVFTSDFTASVTDLKGEIPITLT